MKKHVTETLDNYVQMAEIEDLIANQLARGFSPSTAASLPSIYDRRPSVDRQSTTTADEQLQSEIQKINQRLGRFLERAEFHEEMKKVTSDGNSKLTSDTNQNCNNAPLIDLEAPSKPLPAPPRPPSMSGASVRSSSYENVSLEWRQYVKSTLKQYVSASGQGTTNDCSPSIVRTYGLWSTVRLMLSPTQICMA